MLFRSNTVAVVGNWKVVTWSLPEGDFFPDERVDVERSVQTINLDDQRTAYGTLIAASMSLDLRYVALTSKGWLRRTMCSHLHVYDVSTGQHLCYNIDCWDAVWFPPGGDSVWCAIQNKAEVVAISWEGVDDAANTDNTTNMDDTMNMDDTTDTVDTANMDDTTNFMDDAAVMDDTTDVDDATEVFGIGHWSLGSPWGSSRGYVVTDDGWILGPDGKRLLMLPLPWQSHAVRRVWNGNFVALLHGTLPEPIILELEL